MRCSGMLIALCSTMVALVAPTGAKAQCSTRFVATTGSDPANDCRTSAAPCRTLTHAAAQACEGDTVAVAEGTYVEDVLIGKRVVLDSAGAGANTILRGTGAGDAVRLLASDINVNGFTIDGPAGGACVRIGDTAHPNVRGVQVSSSTLRGCAAGVVVDAVGTAGATVRLAGNTISGQIANGAYGGGAGVVLTGGCGRVQLLQNIIADNDGPAVRIEDPGAARNGTTSIVGNSILRNGRGALALERAAIQARRASDLRIEGNDISGHTGLAGLDDGRAALLADVAGANLYCNRVHENDGGVELTGSASGIEILHNRFHAHAGTALLAQPGTAAGVIVNETVFAGNGLAVDNRDAVSLDARHNWWNAADGPSGAGGSGDPIAGPVDVANLIARPTEPVLARGPSEFGWTASTAGCYDTLQGAIDAAPADGLVLIGAGKLTGRAVLDGKRLDIEGMPNGPHPNCSQSVIDGTQSGGTRAPLLRIKNVRGVTLTNLKLRGAGLGVPCLGPHTDEQIGLDLQNVADATFRGLCIEENGTTEVRVYGDSDRNLFQDVRIEGMLRDIEGDDLCGHRSREGLYVNGGPACEGGPGAIAEDNRFVNVTTYHVTRSFRIRLAKGTEITGGIIHGVPSAAWDGGDYSVGVWVDGADDTFIHDNPELGNRGMHEGIRIQGIAAGSCVTEERHSERTRIENNTVAMVEGAGTGIVLHHDDGDPGYPLDTSITCTGITGTRTAVVAEHVGALPGPVNRLHRMALRGNLDGVRNTAPGVLPVTGSWWGDPSGPSGAGPGTGESVSAGVDYSGWLPSSPLDDADGDGFTECGGDADDTDPILHPLDACDGADNDADGTTDEDFVPQATTCGTGSCARGGATSCSSGTVVDSCRPAPPLSISDATCDRVDDDCDGSSDEEFLRVPTRCGTGACARAGERTCAGGVVEDSCSPGAPAPDDSLCDGVDDDCDGPSDEDYAPSGTTCGRGVCAATGTLACVDGAPRDSCAAGAPALPSDTLCNGLDDDCDGATDEDYVVRGLSCGVGECQRSGSSSCTGGVEEESCMPGLPRGPADVNCDGIDEDCDGAVDEEFEPGPSSCGRGGCVAVGNLSCVSGRIHDTCVPAPPGIESCNGIDDDCDGVLDDVPVPEAVSGLLLSRRPGETRLDWSGAVGATGYDLVRGLLSRLATTGGDFASAADACLGDNLPATSYSDRGGDPPAGDGVWYLLRPVNCGGAGSYDDGGPGQAPGRDREIAASGAACP